MRDTDLAWLAGALDGAGCITTQLRDERWLGTFLRFNTRSVAMAARIKEIYDEIAIKYKQTTRLTDKRPSRLPHIDTTISNMSDVQTVLELCLPYLTTKRPEALAVVEYRGDSKELHDKLQHLKRIVHVQPEEPNAARI